MRRVLLPLLLALALGGATPPAYGPALNGRLFDAAWRLVDRHYWNRPLIAREWPALRDRYRPRIVAAADRRDVYTLLGEMLSRLGDSHVYAIDPVQVAIGRARDRGAAVAGFGFDMLPDDTGRWRVLAVRGGGPAAAAGVEIGWVLRSVEGAPVDIDFQPAPGQPVDFLFTDEDGREHPVTLAAELERRRPVRRATGLPGGVLLLGLDGFDPGADRWMARAIRAAAPRAIIVDLRGNDGGDADVIARVAGLFFVRDRPLVRRIAARETVQMTRGAGPRSWSGPLALLVGPNSASGAEAFAALIAEAKRGTVIGERTAGALTGAGFYRLPDGGQLAVADFDIRTPGGMRLEGRGLDPAVHVTPSLADRRAGRDPALDRARAIVGGA